MLDVKTPPFLNELKKTCKPFKDDHDNYIGTIYNKKLYNWNTQYKTKLITVPVCVYCNETANICLIKRGNRANCIYS